jgi:hypothetical protein
MKTECIREKSLASIHSHLNSLQATGRIPPNLALLFCAPKYDIESIQSIFQSHGIKLCGATTAGEIAEGKIWHDSISCMLFELPEDSFEICICCTKEASIFEIAGRMGKKANTKFANPAVKSIPKIVGISANVSPKDREACIEVGMVDFLPKPFQISQIEDIIKEWVPAKLAIKR